MAQGGITVALVSGGIICLIAAVIGGGLKGLGFDLPALQSVPRQVMLGLLGVVLLGAGVTLRDTAGGEKKATDATAPATSPSSAAGTARLPGAAPTTAAPRGTQWREAQELLIKLGYDPGPADGVAGARTIDVIKRFQSDAGIEVDGYPGARTLALLRERAAAVKE